LKTQRWNESSSLVKHVRYHLLTVVETGFASARLNYKMPFLYSYSSQLLGMMAGSGGVNVLVGYKVLKIVSVA